MSKIIPTVSKNIRRLRKAKGQKGKGSGGKKFLPACQSAEGGHKPPTILQSRNPKEKNFLSFLIKFKIGA